MTKADEGVRWRQAGRLGQAQLLAARCGAEQGDRNGQLIDGKSGDGSFRPASTKARNQRLSPVANALRDS